jgi:hypothetical protein
MDDGCVVDLERGGCNSAVATAIVVEMGRAVVDATAELAGGGKGGGAQQRE